jgi:hypothetical protein
VRIATAWLAVLGIVVTGFAVVAHGARQSATGGGEQRPSPAFEYLGTLQVETGSRTVIENAPQGTRTVVEVLGGRFEGPRMKASVQGPAGDWITNRADGSYKLDVRLTLKTDDGALILVTYNGVGQTTPAGASLRTAPLFETGDARYSWLTRLQAVAVGERVGTKVIYNLYALK